MPTTPAAAVYAHIASGATQPVYLIVGDDDAELSKLASAFSGMVEPALRPFNVDRLYAGEKGVTPGAIVESARLLPMMADRRVVVVLRAERLLKPKRRGKAADADAVSAEDGQEPPTELDVLEAYIRQPVAETTLVLVAADVDRTRKVYRAIQKHAAIVECWGLKGARDARIDLREAARTAERLVREAAAEAGQQIEPRAARLVAERAGLDITRLRGDVGRLLLYTAGKPAISLEDARQIVSAETAQDDWAVTNAIARKDAADALRQLGLALESGGVSYQILGQLAWYVREKMPASDPRRVPAAIESLFRADLDLKTSGGEPRVLLERLVVELCRG